MTRNRSRILSPTEAEQIKTVPPGRGHWLRRVLKDLDVEQVYLVDRLQWTWAGKTPRAIITDLHKKTDLRFDLREEMSGNGWVIKRVA